MERRVLPGNRFGHKKIGGGVMAMDTSKLEKKAREAADKRNYDYAIDLYLQALKVKPDNLEARQALRAVERRKHTENGGGGIGRLFGRMTTVFMSSRGDADKRIVKAEEKLKSDPTNKGALAALGQACMDGGYFTTGVWVYEDLRSVFPEDVRVLRDLAEIYEQANEIKKALDTWEHITKVAPNDRDAGEKIKNLHALTMQDVFEKGARKGSRGIVKDQDAAQSAARAGALRTREDYLDAIKGIESDLEERGNDPNLYVKMGDLYLGMPGQPDFESAAKAYEKAREISPTEHRFAHKIDDVKIRELELAVRALDQKIRGGDESVKAERDKKYKELLGFKLKSFESREKAYTTDMTIAFELGTLYYRFQKFDDAIKRFQRTVKDPKYRTQSALRLGDSFFRKKQFDLAIRQISDGLSVIQVKDDMWKQLTYLRGVVHEATGKAEEAKADFMAIYEMDIDYKDVKNRIEGA